jgi:transcriptional regulator with XRE-family HTH domain
LTVYASYDNLSIIMQIGQRLRILREQESLSQGDVEERTGLLRCYISRVENGHTIPSLETLERLASALEMPLYELFIEGENALSRPDRGAKRTAEQARQAETDGQRRFLEKVRHLIGRIDQKDRKILLYMAEKLARG